MGQTSASISEKKAKDLKPANYNPRKISTEDRKRLKAALQELGDLSGIIFNVQTGNLVGGHRRVEFVPKDADIVITERYAPPTEKGTIAEGYVMLYGERHKYREVDWSLTREKTANVAANTHGGEFDDVMLNEVLKDILQDDTIAIELTGFDIGEIYRLCGEAPLMEQPDRLVELAEKLRSVTDRKDEMKKEIGDREDKSFYVVAVFRNHAARKEFLDVCDQPDTRYIDGALLSRKIVDSRLNSP